MNRLRVTLLASVAAIAGAISTPVAQAQDTHIAGGIIAEYKDIDIAVVAGGWSVGDLLRGNVYNDLGDFIGYVHDAIVIPNGQTTFVIVNVAGFLNIGHKLVAVPSLAFEVNERGDMVLPAATREALEALPNFRYARN